MHTCVNPSCTGLCGTGTIGRARTALNSPHSHLQLADPVAPAATCCLVLLARPLAMVVLNYFGDGHRARLNKLNRHGCIDSGPSDSAVHLFVGQHLEAGA